jgi:hypothetical protein
VTIDSVEAAAMVYNDVLSKAATVIAAKYDIAGSSGIDWSAVIFGDIYASVE